MPEKEQTPAERLAELARRERDKQGRQNPERGENSGPAEPSRSSHMSA
jgi:hypothetical protein